MPNPFCCFSASRSRPDTSTNTHSDTAGVKKRWVALPEKSVRALSEPGFVDVLQSAADHIRNHPRAARHVMDCLQGKGAPDDTDTWLQGQRLDHHRQGICATLFSANRFGHTESESKTLLKIVYVVEQLKVLGRRSEEVVPIGSGTSRAETTPDVGDMIADMAAQSVGQTKAALEGYPLETTTVRDDLRPTIQPFLETRWKAVLDTCLAGGHEDALQRIQTLNLCPATVSPPPEWRCAWHQICFDALVVAIQMHKDHPLIHPLLDRVMANLGQFKLNGVPLASWGFTQLIELGRTDRETFPLLSLAVFCRTSMQELHDRLEVHVAAQSQTVPGDNSRTRWEQSLAEAKEAPAKVGHYMWYAYPQLRFTEKEIGFTPSWTARQFGIEDEYEAQAYLEHPILGDRLRTLCRHLLNRSDITARGFFGEDACKFQSCLTLFAGATQSAQRVLVRSIDTAHAEADRMRWKEDESLFLDCLNRFYGGQADPKTEERLPGKLQKEVDIANLEDSSDGTPNITR